MFQRNWSELRHRFIWSDATVDTGHTTLHWMMPSIVKSYRTGLSRRVSVSIIPSANTFRHSSEEKYLRLSSPPSHHLPTSDLYNNVNQQAETACTTSESKLNQNRDCRCDSEETKTVFKSRSALLQNMHVLPMNHHMPGYHGKTEYAGHVYSETREHVPVKYEGFRPVQTKHFRPSQCSGYQVTTSASWSQSSWPSLACCNIHVSCKSPRHHQQWSKPSKDHQTVTALDFNQKCRSWEDAAI